MMPQRCPCGQRIDATIQPDGVAYRITFTVPGSGEPPLHVDHCPNCDRDLGEALITGELQDAEPCA